MILQKLIPKPPCQSHPSLYIYIYLPPFIIYFPLEIGKKIDIIDSSLIIN